MSKVSMCINNATKAYIFMCGVLFYLFEKVRYPWRKIAKDIHRGLAISICICFISAGLYADISAIIAFDVSTYRAVFWICVLSLGTGFSISYFLTRSDIRRLKKEAEKQKQIAELKKEMIGAKRGLLYDKPFLKGAISILKEVGFDFHAFNGFFLPTLFWEISDAELMATTLGTVIAVLSKDNTGDFDRFAKEVSDGICGLIKNGKRTLAICIAIELTAKNRAFGLRVASFCKQGEGGDRL